MVEAGFAHAATVFVLSPTGQSDQRDATRARDLAQPARHFAAIHVGHADVEQHDMRLAARELR
jgi:hypothetical protein